MRVRGIVHGKTIELLEALPIPDGLEIFIEIPDNLSPELDGKWQQLQAIIGAWKDDMARKVTFGYEIHRRRI